MNVIERAKAEVEREALTSDFVQDLYERGRRHGYRSGMVRGATFAATITTEQMQAGRRAQGEHRPIHDERGDLRSCTCGVLYGVQHPDNYDHEGHVLRFIFEAMGFIVAETGR